MFRRTFCVVAVASAVALSTACGSGSTKGSTSPSPSASATAAPSSAPSGGSSNLHASLVKFAGATFAADYTITVAGSQALTNATMKITQDGTKGLRVDLTGQQNGKDVSITIIDAGSTSVFCIKGVQVPGGTDASGSCLNSNSVIANPGAGIKNTLQRFEASDVTVLDTSSRTIAGRHATCYHTQKAGETTTSTVCIDGNGVLLYGKTDGPNASEITATDVSSSVPGSPFTPPYPVRSLPGVPGAAGSPAGQ